MLSKIKSLRNHKGFMKYFRNTSWLFLERILRLIVGLLVGVWVARYLGPEKFGLLSYIQSFVGLFAAIATLGLNGIVVRELVKDENRRDELIATSFWLKIMGSIFVLIILAIGISFTSSNRETNILVFIIASATIFQSFNVVDLYFQSKVKSKYIVYINALALCISSGVKILFILTEAPLIAFAWVILADSVILALGFLYLYIKDIEVLKFSHVKFNKITAVRLLKDSWPYIISGVMVSLLMKTDQIMINFLIGNEATGYYSAAIRLSEAWYFIPTVILASLFPAIINGKKVSEKIYEERLQNLYNYLILFSLFVAIIVTIFSSNIIVLLYSEKYLPSVQILTVHIWIGVMVAHGVILGKWVLVENLQKYSLYMGILQIMLNIILNYWFIRYFDVVGAAYATLCTSIISNLLMVILFPKFKIPMKMLMKSFVFPYYLIRRKS